MTPATLETGPSDDDYEGSNMVRQRGWRTSTSALSQLPRKPHSDQNAWSNESNQIRLEQSLDYGLSKKKNKKRKITFFNTRSKPEILLPYLRENHLEEIEEETHCSIEYLPAESLDKTSTTTVTAPYSISFLIIFADQLDLRDAYTMLHVAIEKIDRHIQRKRRISRTYSHRAYGPSFSLTERNRMFDCGVTSPQKRHAPMYIAETESNRQQENEEIVIKSEPGSETSPASSSDSKDKADTTTGNRVRKGPTIAELPSNSEISNRKSTFRGSFRDLNDEEVDQRPMSMSRRRHRVEEAFLDPPYLGREKYYRNRLQGIENDTRERVRKQTEEMMSPPRSIYKRPSMHRYPGYWHDDEVEGFEENEVIDERVMSASISSNMTENARDEEINTVDGQGLRTRDRRDSMIDDRRLLKRAKLARWRQLGYRPRYDAVRLLGIEEEDLMEDEEDWDDFDFYPIRTPMRNRAEMRRRYLVRARNQLMMLNDQFNEEPVDRKRRKMSLRSPKQEPLDEQDSIFSKHIAVDETAHSFSHEGVKASVIGKENGVTTPRPVDDASERINKANEAITEHDMSNDCIVGGSASQIDADIALSVATPKATEVTCENACDQQSKELNVTQAEGAVAEVEDPVRTSHDFLTVTLGEDKKINFTKLKLVENVEKQEKCLKNVSDEALALEELHSCLDGIFAIQQYVGECEVIDLKSRRRVLGKLNEALDQAMKEHQLDARIEKLRCALMDLINSEDVTKWMKQEDVESIVEDEKENNEPEEDTDLSPRTSCEDLGPLLEPDPEMDISDEEDLITARIRKRTASIERISLPSFVPTFLQNLLESIPLPACEKSNVMVNMVSRLLSEMSRANPYHYLQLIDSYDQGDKSNQSSKSAKVDIKLGKIEKKSISQITSRIKWFEMIATSLLRNRVSSIEVISRKKMNSTIRKLHLVAIQIHSFVSFLCNGCLGVTKSSTPPESTVANSLSHSFHEKRMNAYKSRLKLCVQLNGSSSEDLLRDTYEFFPELLLCVDMWGYEYRQKSSKLIQHLPMEVFKKVEDATFDYKTDKNEAIQTIGEELLNLSTYWNELCEELPIGTQEGEIFKCSFDQVKKFEMQVKSSTCKILDTYTRHLLGSWASLLMKEPNRLDVYRLTQHKVYYFDTKGLGGFKTEISLDNIQSHIQEDISNDVIMTGNDADTSIMVDEFWAKNFSNTKTSGKIADINSVCNIIPIKDVLTWSDQEIEKHRLKLSQLHMNRNQLRVLAAASLRVMKEDSKSEVRKQPQVNDLLCKLGCLTSISQEAVRLGEGVALHSVAEELTEGERKHRSSSHINEDYQDEEMTGVNGADVPRMRTRSSSQLMETKETKPFGKELQMVDEETKEDEVEKAMETDSIASSHYDEEEQVGGDQQEHMWEISDVIDIVMSTQRELEEILSDQKRTRSARMKDRLQSQSLHVARETYEILQSLVQRDPTIKTKTKSNRPQRIKKKIPL